MPSSLERLSSTPPFLLPGFDRTFATLRATQAAGGRALCAQHGPQALQQQRGKVRDTGTAGRELWRARPAPLLGTGGAGRAGGARCGVRGELGAGQGIGAGRGGSSVRGQARCSDPRAGPGSVRGPPGGAGLRAPSAPARRGRGGAARPYKGGGGGGAAATHRHRRALRGRAPAPGAAMRRL